MASSDSKRGRLASEPTQGRVAPSSSSMVSRGAWPRRARIAESIEDVGGHDALAARDQPVSIPAHGARVGGD